MALLYYRIIMPCWWLWFTSIVAGWGAGYLSPLEACTTLSGEKMSYLGEGLWVKTSSDSLVSKAHRVSKIRIYLLPLGSTRGQS